MAIRRNFDPRGASVFDARDDLGLEAMPHEIDLPPDAVYRSVLPAIESGVRTRGQIFSRSVEPGMSAVARPAKTRLSDRVFSYPRQRSTVARTPRRSFYGGVRAKVSYKVPDVIRRCQQRLTRMEVLFARGVGGKRGGSPGKRGYRRDEFSNYSCW